MDILITTDFSACAQAAIKAAIQIAKKRKATLYLFNSIEFPSFWILNSNDSRYQELISNYKSEFVLPKLTSIQREINQEGISCEVIIKEGDFLETIKQVTENQSFDLVCMGSKGRSGKEEWFIGSNTQKAVRSIRNNVLIIKDNLHPIQFKNVAYVSGLNENEKLSFKKFIQEISKFNVQEIHLLSIDLSGYFSQPTFLMKEVLDDYKKIAINHEIKTHFYPSHSVDAGVRKFVVENDIDIVAISNHVKHPIKRFFSGSNVEMILNHSDVPVLSIDY